MGVTVNNDGFGDLGEAEELLMLVLAWASVMINALH